jgi:hypothetical protein
MKTSIEKYDEVAVNFHNSQFTLTKKATVLRIPAGFGDSWIFKDLEDGRLHYVSEGCTVTALEK